MKAAIRFLKPAVILGGLIMALPVASLADKGGNPNKGGMPNENSVATTAACIEADGSVHAYSCKALSNVVIWCGNTYIKFDDLGVDPDTGDEVYDQVFSCGDAGGDISFVAIKSGSQKHSKHNSGYTAPDGLPDDPPSGSGLFVGDIPTCLTLATTPELIPEPGDCDAAADDPEPPIILN